MEAEASSPSVPVPPKPRRKRRSISLVAKEKIIQECERALREKLSFRKLAKKMDMNPQTISHIWKHREKILEHLEKNRAQEQAAPATIVANRRFPTIEAMENVLVSWVDEQTAKGIQLTKVQLCDKAKAIVEHYDAKLQPSRPTNFQASSGWLRNFHKRFDFKQKLSCLTSQKENLDDKRTQAFVAEFEEMVRQGNYLPEQIFTVDEIGLNWKMSKGHPVRVTMLIGGNAAGDFKLKPLLINHSEAPRALLHVNRNSLPVTYRANKVLCMTLEIFKKWFYKSFLSQVREYLQGKGIEYKVLLVIDSVPAHSKTLGCGSSCDKVKLMFIPPLVSCKVQPMANCDLVKAFRAYYLKRTMKLAEEYLKSNAEKEKKSTIQSFWKSYTIRQCIDNVGQAWNDDISQAAVLSAWRKLYPTNPTAVNPPEVSKVEPSLNEISGELAEEFQPLLENINEDLVDFTELPQDQIAKLQSESNELQLQEEAKCTVKPEPSSLSDLSSSLPATSAAVQSMSALQPSASTERWPVSSIEPSSAVLHRHDIATTSSNTTTSSTATASSGLFSSSPCSTVLPMPRNRKRPLLEEALRNGSIGVKLNGLSNGGSHQPKPINPFRPVEAVQKPNGFGITPAMLEDCPTLHRTLGYMIGEDRTLLLLRVLSLPDNKVSLARQMMKLLDSDQNDGRTLTLDKTVAENRKLIAILVQNYYNLTGTNYPPVKPTVYPHPPENGGQISRSPPPPKLKPPPPSQLFTMPQPKHK